MALSPISPQEMFLQPLSRPREEKEEDDEDDYHSPYHPYRIHHHHHHLHTLVTTMKSKSSVPMKVEKMLIFSFRRCLVAG